jgi:hypothetical protein
MPHPRPLAFGLPMACVWLACRWLDFFFLNQAHVGVFYRSGFSRMAIRTSYRRAVADGTIAELNGNRTLECDRYSQMRSL